MKKQIVYKLDGIDAEVGIDIFEIAPILMNFGDLIKSANSVLGYDQKIEVKVKPFREGSWITEFVLQHETAKTLMSYMTTPEGQGMVILLNLLGFNVKEGIHGLINIIRFTKGKVSNFKKSDDKKTVVYTSPDGGEIKVTLAEHRLVQSPIIQTNYYNCIVVPLDRFPEATSVSFKTDDENAKEEIITDKDKKHFEEYAKTELLEDVDANISKIDNVFLKPKRGSYSGEEKAYSFVMGDNNVLWPVTIDDEEFLRKMRSGELRLYSEDVLRANMEISQKKDAANKIVTTYSIKKVLEYIEHQKPQQIELGDLI